MSGITRFIKSQRHPHMWSAIGYSLLGDFFNVSLLENLPGGVISTHEFFLREQQRLKIPDKFAHYGKETLTWLRDGDPQWFDWLDSTFGSVAAGPDKNVVSFFQKVMGCCVRV